MPNSEGKLHCPSARQLMHLCYTHVQYYTHTCTYRHWLKTNHGDCYRSLLMLTSHIKLVLRVEVKRLCS